jgi:hypothetical protein
MKITKTQLKQIIREELLKEAHPSASVAINLLEDVMQQIAPIINDAYDRLRDPEEQQTFESFLNKNIRLMSRQWEEKRSAYRYAEEPAEEEEPIGRGFEGWASRNPSATGAE